MLPCLAVEDETVQSWGKHGQYLGTSPLRRSKLMRENITNMTVKFVNLLYKNVSAAAKPCYIGWNMR